MPVIGGIGTVWGPVLGGIVFVIVEEQISVNFPNFHLLIYGLLLIIIILLEPDGLLGLLRRLFRLLRGKRGDSGSPGADEVLWGRSRVEGREL
jgi:branched-chain amino acid transport system permease protein